MDRIIIYRLVGITMVIIGVFAFLFGLLFSNKFVESSGFAAFFIGGALVYYATHVRPAEMLSEEEKRKLDELAQRNAPMKK